MVHSSETAIIVPAKIKKLFFKEKILGKILIIVGILHLTFLHAAGSKYFIGGQSKEGRKNRKIRRD